MSVRMTIELREKGAAKPVVQAIETYKIRLQGGIERSKNRLGHFERHYGVDTAHFLEKMTAEDLENLDIEHVGGDEGCALEVDLEYPEELHDSHNTYPLAPERMLIDD